jgi:hypothetical protein
MEDSLVSAEIRTHTIHHRAIQTVIPDTMVRNNNQFASPNVTEIVPAFAFQ